MESKASNSRNKNINSSCNDFCDRMEKNAIKNLIKNIKNNKDSDRDALDIALDNERNITNGCARLILKKKEYIKDEVNKKVKGKNEFSKR